MALNNVSKINKILNFGANVLKEAYDNDGYRLDVRDGNYNYKVNGYDPGEDYDEAQIHEIFGRAGVHSKILKNDRYIVGFEIDKPNVEQLNKTLKLIDFTKDIINFVNDEGVLDYREINNDSEKSGFNIHNRGDYNFVYHSLYRAGFNLQSYKENGMLKGFTTYDPDRAQVFRTENGIKAVINDVKPKSDNALLSKFSILEDSIIDSKLRGDEGYEY
jgi:hypothetical protein